MSPYQLAPDAMGKSRRIRRTRVRDVFVGQEGLLHPPAEEVKLGIGGSLDQVLMGGYSRLFQGV